MNFIKYQTGAVLAFIMFLTIFSSTLDATIYALWSLQFIPAPWGAATLLLGPPALAMVLLLLTITTAAAKLLGLSTYNTIRNITATTWTAALFPLAINIIPIVIAAALQLSACAEIMKE